ncbi:MAG: hypothetical protein A2622_06515 [Bdellovibrionales bacterium RIFCSPHIGHO2_01_FULL_40_29]|nr:MAG: hypothetical protein A2622_06515 [Bdellovibrionales bacterium RIFCSPHIGHO2_01_FULL_40_29]OFZ35096.1 MAG: hypothetical protein A3D17_06865 [Bdellovibrionales bacterium RIFCSPHIGHO2_02_FULL_40_15]
MKIILFLLILTAYCLAFTQENPAEFCTNNEFCTPQMVEISRLYQNGNLDFTSSDATAFSGACYHLNHLYNPTIEHHAGFAFEQVDSGLYAGGIFSFFAETDPFKDLTAEELTHWLKSSSSKFKKTAITDGHLELEYIYPESEIRYWFRGTPQGGLAIIGQDAGSNNINLVFCNLSAR